MDLGESDALPGLMSVLAQQQQPFLPDAVSVKCNMEFDSFVASALVSLMADPKKRIHSPVRRFV